MAWDPHQRVFAKWRTWIGSALAGAAADPGVARGHGHSRAQPFEAPRRPIVEITVRAIGAGKVQAQVTAAEDAEDDALWDDDAAAGVQWAREHHPKNASACPVLSAAFHKACAAEAR
jgi:hypothetical protein